MKRSREKKPFRKSLFFGLLSAAFLLCFIFVWCELILPMQLHSTILGALFVIFFLAFGLQILHLTRIHKQKQSSARVFVTFFFAGLFIHLLCAALTKDILVWVFGLFEYESIICYAFACIAMGFNLLGVRAAYRGPQIKNVPIPMAHQHAKLSGFKIVQISDLHIGPLVRKKYVQAVVNKILPLKPDLIVLTGDIGDSDPRIFGKDLSPLKQLSTLCEVFYVTGNHEYYWNASKWVTEIETLGITALINQGLLIAQGKIWLGGVTDPDAGYFIPEHEPDITKAIDLQKSKDAYKIILAHQPKSCFDAEKAGFDLMLSGHTHGGQFFPFNLLVRFFNPYSKGLNQHGKMKVYVNQGTGFWGPALRLGVPAEITLIKLSETR